MNTSLIPNAARLFLFTAFACLLASCCACAVPGVGAQSMNMNVTITNANVTISNMNGAVAPVPMPEEPKSTVYGRAVYDDTGRPVKRARVQLLNIEGRGQQYAGLTNANGEFRIRKVPVGNYFVTVDAPGVMSPVSFLDIQEMRGNSHPDLREVRKHFDEVDVDGKSDREVNVRAKRGASVSGRVTYADGDPAINVSVSIMRRRGERLAQLITGVNPATLYSMRTDDRGVFRVAGLPPGEYLVAVSETVEHGESDAGRYDPMEASIFGNPLMMTFYPSATRAGQATPVRVEAGEDRDGVDITIAERALHTLSGVVRGGRDGRPVASASVRFAPKVPASGVDATLSSPYEETRGTVQTDEQGLWQLREIPDGVYIISVNPPSVYESATTATTTGGVDGAPPTRPRRPKKRYAPKQQEVKVAGGDVANINIVVNEGGRISGTYVYEDKQPASYQYASFYVERAEEGETAGGERITGGGSDGKFTIDGIPPGRMYLRASLYNEDTEKTYVKSMTWRGRDLLREPLEIAQGTDVEGVQVVMSSEVATLDVRAVSGTDKNAARGVVIILAPVDPTQWPHPDTQLSCASGRDGTCAISGAPGEYLVIALTSGERVESVGDVIKRRAAGAPRVSLRAGERKSLEVLTPSGN
ncbi:MAG: carboxypeptidase-like regulatory domain-containing protein [Acidobacteria bacterium]|nr:carboxypeptidase-like regulatory domain-containing protein [Acidobacteriota bacterium]